MPKNIVICSDGTGNTFDRSVSNVGRLVELLASSAAARQVVVYDQGIGTNAERLRAVNEYRATLADRDSLIVLPGAKSWWFAPMSGIARLLGLIGGFGFRANVAQMYRALSLAHDDTADLVYLFGFSRGAFTIRALAGLLYRCGLPDKELARDGARFDAFFADAYRLYAARTMDPATMAAFRETYDLRECRVHFLGVWDTVKSYGGVLPIMLPHLRHNPIVGIVRHAVALDERRSWFNATTWGLLDSDERGAMKRLVSDELPAYEEQRTRIEEVWFRGCHSDVGGGDEEAATARIPLRWMLGEAAAAGLLLNDEGEAVLSEEDPVEPARIHQSLRGGWWASEILPRWEIDNSGEYPRRSLVWKSTGRRTPDRLTRGGRIVLHTSVGDRHSLTVPVEHRATSRSAISSRTSC